ncbi:hypothetical protein KEJ32_03450 [Candidatus Bathyarchaeota archaeon]|nr:hypothetical protein [Candidatus Bathyarchaeota archaeon]
MKSKRFELKERGKEAVSPAISMVIITAVTVVLVLVAGNYAYQVLERQRAASEFDTVKKSFITFDDAIRDIAWDISGARSARFTINYGVLEVMPANAIKGLPINVTVINYPDAKYINFTGYLRYNLSIYYVTFGDGYKSYLFGDSRTVISKGTENFGTALVEQRSSWVSLTLYYRVKVSRTSVVQVGSDIVNYVEILIIKITAARWSVYKGDIDLAARNKAITTISYGAYNAGNNCTISVSIGGLNDIISVNLEPGKVVFNFVITEVQVDA